MRVVNVAVQQLYRFKCPNCGSSLEAEIGDLTDIGNKISKFYCPVCETDRYICWSAVRSKTVYEPSR